MADGQGVGETYGTWCRTAVVWVGVRMRVMVRLRVRVG